MLRHSRSELGKDEIREFLTKAIRNGEQIERLVSDILTLARLDSGEFTYDLTTLDLGSVVERADSEMRGVTGRSIGFSREADLRPALARLSKRGEHDVEGIGLGPSFVGDCRDLLSDGL